MLILEERSHTSAEYTLAGQTAALYEISPAPSLHRASTDALIGGFLPNNSAVGRVHNVEQPMLACSPDPTHSSLRIGS